MATFETAVPVTIPISPLLTTVVMPEPPGNLLPISLPTSVNERLARSDATHPRNTWNRNTSCAEIAMNWPKMPLYRPIDRFEITVENGVYGAPPHDAGRWWPKT